MFKGNITIDDEGGLHSTLSGRFVEFVLYILDEVVAFIIESKTEIVSDSIAQLFMELHGTPFVLHISPVLEERCMCDLPCEAILGYKICAMACCIYAVLLQLG